MWFHPEVIDEGWLDDEVDEALAPYRQRCPPNVLARRRETLCDMLLYRPGMAPLTRAALPSKTVERSGDIATGADPAAEDPAEKKSAGQ